MGTLYECDLVLVLFRNKFKVHPGNSSTSSPDTFVATLAFFNETRIANTKVRSRTLPIVAAIWAMSYTSVSGHARGVLDVAFLAGANIRTRTFTV